MFLSTFIEVQEYRRGGAFGVVFPFCNFFVVACVSARSRAGRLRPRPSLCDNRPEALSDEELMKLHGAIREFGMARSR